MLHSAPASLAFFLATLYTSVAIADCGVLLESLESSVSAADTVKADQLMTEVNSARDCGPRDRRQAKRLYANALVALAKKMPSDEAEAERLTTVAAQLNSSWRASAAFADLAFSRKDYVGAAESFMAAIELLDADRVEFEDTGEKDPMEPSEADITYVVARADEARQLAGAGINGVFVEAPITRNGLAGGVFSGVTNRGAEAFKVPVPIIFKYDSAEFTPVGLEAADELVRVLKERASAQITVTGHTDAKGSDEYNLALSMKRAEAVVAYLRQNEIKGEIRAVGKGKSEPRKLSDPASFSAAQIDELNRRVEFDWSE